MQTRKLKGHEYTQARIDSTTDGNFEMLVSYDTDVLEKVINFQGSGRTAYRLNGLYSRTTIKHISLYMREEGISYYRIKPCANTEWLLILPIEGDNFMFRYYNQETGEIIETYNRGIQSQLPPRYLNKYNLDHEKYSDLIYHDGTEMAGYYRY